MENISDRITTEEALTQQTMKLVEVLNNSNSEKTISFGQKKKILIAEDDASARTVAVKYLQTEGYEITEAEDGNEAIALLNKNNFDLLILDLHMPFRDGYEILQCLPNDERPSILVCSAAKDKIQHFTKTFQFGADDYIEKPYDRIELILRVKALLRHKEKLIEAQRNSELDELTGLYN